MEPITFQNALDYKTFVKASFVMFYNNWRVKAVYLLFLFVFVSAIFAPDSKNPILSASLILVIAIVFTAILYQKVQSIYKTSSISDEGSTWIMNDSGIEIFRNDAFHKLNWNTIYKISITKHWVFIWFNKFQCTFFPRNKVSEDQLLQIYHLVTSNKTKA